MICYLDRTFCSTPLDLCTCPDSRKLTPDKIEAATRWWGGPDFPVCSSALCNQNENEPISNNVPLPNLSRRPV